MKKLTLSLLSGLALTGAGLSAQTVVWSEGFNSGFVDPFAPNPASFGYQFGGTLRSNGWNGITGIEGDKFTSAAFDSTGAAAASQHEVVTLGEITSAGVTYTFSGDFGWNGTATGGQTAADDLFFRDLHTGFLVIDGGTKTLEKNAVLDVNIGEDFVEGTLNLVTFSYTTVAGDIGNDLGFRIRIQDAGAVDDSIQVVADNWQVTSVPEPSAYALIGGCLALTSVMLRRRR